ncbi:LysR substrate-binding domain-containing protein [Noviherbaspirillum saxi]|uniref:LysR family transcriptional regulator n=1 Tax=Noviherbaspirillum saxi TaxID=2320863 RepID=A0A3A3FF17_9BURK|nr:LysR substrate-binding domain-containing protein [Noviherbaspirillum saxi]RJF91926.1 LysR family transcriptional regulator [Noviherbaspirillum saxi]
MRKVNFDLDALRSFATGIELGSFAKAADRAGRSASAVSAQLKKLEEQAGRPLLQKSGRGMVLTNAGEILLSYARRMLSLNDEAALAIAGHEIEGSVRLGLQEDFSEHLLPAVLGEFARSHPGVRIEVRVARNAELLAGIVDGHLDLALAWHTGANTLHMSILGSYPLRWIGPADTAGPAWPGPSALLPLVTFESPCQLRTAATQALDGAAIPWRIVYSSPSLSGVWAAITAGLGVTVRTEFGLPATLTPLLPSAAGLPELPSIGLALHRSQAELTPASWRLHEVIKERLTTHQMRK